VTLRVHPDEIVFADPSGVLAAHPTWERVRLGHIADVINGFAFPSAGFGAAGEIPLIRIRDVGRAGTNTWYSGPYDDAYIVEPGSLIIGMDGDFRVDRWAGPRALLNQRVCKLSIPNASLYSESFLRWVLPGYLDAVHRETSSVTVKHLSSETIKELPIPLPPRAEQDRIVAAIEEQFSRLDAGVAALERARQNLKRMRDAIRFAATLGRLVPQDPDDEPAASLIARVKPTGRFRGTKPLPSGLGQLPPGWSWALMGSLARRVTVGHVGPMKDEYIDDGIPFLRSQNVREDRFDPNGLRFISPSFHERLSKSHLTPGDLVIVRSGNVGTACVVPDSLNEANCADLVIVQGPEAIDAHYAALYMNSLARSRVRAGRVGVALTHFNTQSVAELPVPVPPMSEQKRITAQAQSLMSVVDSLEADLLGGLRRADALRSSILSTAFSGQLVAHDPADEPARVLVERIAEERASAEGHKTTRPRTLQLLPEVTA
jgi:type I restriction enzyme, S subunit